jgi:hypothetical protein
MDMIGHNAIGKHLHSFIFSAISNAFYKYSAIKLSRENIYPFYRSKTDEI